MSDTDSDANTLAESVSNGTSADITASATDADGTTNTVTYAINSQSCSGAFAIDSGSGAVTVADTSAIDYGTATSCTITVRATSADGSDLGYNVHRDEITDIDEFDVGAVSDTDSDANTLAENAANGASAEITASATDADGTTNTVTYAINSQSCSAPSPSTPGSGAITVADTSAIDYETATSCTITVRATMPTARARTPRSPCPSAIMTSSTWAPRATPTPDANTLAENVANGASAEITASATDADGTTNTVTYAINSQSCTGAFAIDSGSGAITVADTSAIDYETATSCTITVRATSADGSSSDTTFTVTVTDHDEFDVGLLERHRL